MEAQTISDNWVVRNHENALGTWNEKLSELWTLITQTPETFRGGQIWGVIVNINSALVGIGYGLLVLFFAMGVFQSAASFRDLQRPEFALRHFLCFAAAKVAVGYGMEIMTAIFGICGGVVETVMGGVGTAVTQTASLPAEIVTAIEDVGFMESIPLWLVSILGSLFITVMSFIHGFVWVKFNPESDGIFWGMGYWTRSNAEICLIATKGHPQRKAANVHQIIISHAEEHSKKPEEARRRIEALMGDAQAGAVCAP